MDSDGRAPSSTWERRIHAEWNLLQELAELNPKRLDHLSAEDTTFRLTLKQTPSPRLGSFLYGQGLSFITATEHRIRIEYPAFFPSLPMELYLDQAVAHPNIDPESGFVCLWQQHRVSNSIEHALHKTVAMLGWKLRNCDPVHLMQPAVSNYAMLHGNQVAEVLNTAALAGVQRDAYADFEEMSRRLSLPRKRLSQWRMSETIPSHRWKSQ